MTVDLAYKARDLKISCAAQWRPGDIDKVSKMSV